MIPALMYETLQDDRVRCAICQHRCIIERGRRGRCKTRINEGGKLYTLIYGRVSSISINPIEKKPVFHFYPGSRWLSLGSLGCNFRCPGCQNWEIAHAKGKGVEGGQFLAPADSIRLAKREGCLGISWTFNEPTIWFEYTLEGAKQAKSEGLFTNYVTNGYITQEALDEIGPYLDLFRVDIKGFSKTTYRRIGHIPDFAGILNVTKRAKERWGMHVEVVTNITPGYNDDPDELRDMARWISKELGDSTPWHVTRFHPHRHLSHLMPTPIKTLERARQIGMEEGLKFVYIGNVPGHPGENTYCPKCGILLIERYVFDITAYNLAHGKCSRCITPIPGRFSKP